MVLIALRGRYGAERGRGGEDALPTWRWRNEGGKGRRIVGGEGRGFEGFESALSGRGEAPAGRPEWAEMGFPRRLDGALSANHALPCLLGPDPCPPSTF